MYKRAPVKLLTLMMIAMKYSWLGNIQVFHAAVDRSFWMEPKKMLHLALAYPEAMRLLVNERYSYHSTNPK